MDHLEQIQRRSGDRFAYFMIDHGKADGTIDWETAVVRNVFGLAFDDPAWRYPRTLSFPGIRFSTGSGSLQPSTSGDDRQNMTIEWATPRNNFHQSIVDSSNRYEITLKSIVGTQTAQITPRNTNSFRPWQQTVNRSGCVDCWRNRHASRYKLSVIG